jgi:hypothetical protein
MARSNGLGSFPLSFVSRLYSTQCSDFGDAEIVTCVSALLLLPMMLLELCVCVVEILREPTNREPLC